MKTIAIIWDHNGNIMHKCDSVKEAEEIIKEYGYEELTRTYNKNEVNIGVFNY
jgi:hypothetical protein